MKNNKFKFWHKKHKVMYHLFEGELAYDNGEWADALDWNDVMMGKVDGILLPYTGIVDKNGTEICEGDIVKVEDVFSSYMGEVRIGRFCHNSNGHTIVGSYILTFDEQGIPYNTYQLWASYENEVLGNIYEDPDLLNQLIRIKNEQN